MEKNININCVSGGVNENQPTIFKKNTEKLVLIRD